MVDAPPKQRRYLYAFGYEMPRQAQHSTFLRDDEDSRCVWIIAPSADAALAWGRQISERFVAQLFNDTSVSWMNGHFSHWVEDPPDAIRRTDGIPEVQCGQYPDFNSWIGSVNSNKAEGRKP